MRENYQNTFASRGAPPNELEARCAGEGAGSICRPSLVPPQLRAFMDTTIYHERSEESVSNLTVPTIIAIEWISQVL